MAGVYIHIPFCRTRCHYCDFYKTLEQGLENPYISALIREMDIRSDYLGQDTVETIYFGGGTPSVVGNNMIGELLENIHKRFNIAEEAEITIEVNPDDTSREFYRTAAAAGINRLSIGVQSWDDNILKFLNRRHSAGQARSSVSDALQEGFRNISVDMIYGIPGLTSHEWEQGLEETYAMEISHLSAYHLTIEKDTHFGRLKNEGSISEVDEQESENQFRILVKSSKEHGFEQYEISNLARNSLYSKHNTNYWKQVPYIGLGPSAHSFNGYSRQWNQSDINSYIKALAQGKVPFERELLDERMKYNEYIMTSLRTMWGIDLEHIESGFNKETHDYLLNMASRFIKYGMVNLISSNRLVLTDQGKMISDNIISELMMG